MVKTIQRAQSGGEGADIAQRHVEVLAKKHGVTVDQLAEAAKAGAPDTFYRFAPAVQIQLDAFRDELRQSISVMEADGISKDAIKHIFLHFAQTL